MHPLVQVDRRYRDTLRHSPYRWWLVLGSLLYLLSPVDLSPDVFPLLGWLDDGWLVAVLVGELMTLVFGKAMPATSPGVVGDVAAQPVPDDD